MRHFLNDVPDEVLFKIVRCFESTFDETELRFDSEFHANIGTIQNLRLTCRRLNDISSPFLVPYIHVTPTLSSLNHLDQVASHPTISRGVRRIFVNMAVLVAELADNFRSFTRSRYDKLENILLFYGLNRLDIPIMWDFAKKADDATEILDCINSPDDGSWPFSNSERKKMSRLRKVLEREQAIYRKLYEQQKSILQSGRLRRSIATAAASLGNGSNIGLYISDEHKDPVHGDPYGIRRPLHEHGDRKMDYDFVIRFVGMREGQRWAEARDELISEATQSVLSELPLAISAAGPTLTELVVDTSKPSSTPRPALVMTQEQISALEQISTSLKTFKFNAGGELGGGYSAAIKSLSTYVSALTGSHMLAHLTLDMKFLDRHYGEIHPVSPNPCAIGPLDLSEPWEKLETLALSEYAVHPNELEKLMGALKPGVKITFKRISLCRGSWAEALDHIRAKAGPGSEISQCFGSDADVLSPRYNDIFRSLPSPWGNWATEYIRSVKGFGNPFRKRHAPRYV